MKQTLCKRTLLIQTLVIISTFYCNNCLGQASAPKNNSLLLLMPGIIAASTQPTNVLTPPVATFKAALNDTGVLVGLSLMDNLPYSSTSIANSNCTGDIIESQDCSYGRDANLNDNSNGYAGFDFTKLDTTGKELPTNATQWSCVKDNVTGLMWEVKINDGGLHDRDDRYHWYNTNPATNGGDVGWNAINNNICYGYVPGKASTYCNTQAFVERVNSTKLCGQNNWRMPTNNELVSIMSFDQINPAIDKKYFPNTNTSVGSGFDGGSYWTGSVKGQGDDYLGRPYRRIDTVTFDIETKRTVAFSISGTRYYVRLVHSRK